MREQLRLIIIAGIQGAGKSTLANYIVDNGLQSDFVNVEKGKAVHIDIDKYYKSNRLDHRAYYQDIGIELEARVPRNESVVVTATPIGIKRLMDGIKEYYKMGVDGKVKMLFIHCDLGLAQERCRQRVEQGGHAVDMNILPPSYKRIPDFIKEVQKSNIPIYDVVEYEKEKTPKVTEHNPANHKTSGLSK